MRNPFKSCFYATCSRDKAAVDNRDAADDLPPPYELNPQVESSLNLPNYTLPSHHVLSLKRCLIWQMAMDWKLHRHVAKLEKPSDSEYHAFEERCKVFGSILGHRYQSPHDLLIAKKSLETHVFKPGMRIGIERNLQEFFMFSSRRAAKDSFKPLSSHRDEMMLIRSVLDSKFLVDLVTDPDSTFARKLKSKCAKLHAENFSWLLDPALISLDESAKARATDIYSKNWNNGRWKETELLMRECLRPCAVLMDPSQTMLTMYEVDVAYFRPGVKSYQQPGFNLRTFQIHENLLPASVVCLPFGWKNRDGVDEDSHKQDTGPTDNTEAKAS